MNYMKFSNLEGKHAVLAPSRHGWENKDIPELLESYARSYATDIGTAMHDIARKHIELHSKISNSDKKEIKLQLISYYHIPQFAVNRGVDFDMIFETIKLYVNDAVGYRLQPEVTLVHNEEFAFGTADTISDLDSVFKKRFLRIHDLKTGVREVDIAQLEKYAALFCLQYHVKPTDIDMELRIYQFGECEIHTPSPEAIAELMDIYVTDTNALTRLKAEES